jgi:UDP-galactopyranose mutase
LFSSHEDKATIEATEEITLMANSKKFTLPVNLAAIKMIFKMKKSSRTSREAEYYFQEAVSKYYLKKKSLRDFLILCLTR